MKTWGAQHMCHCTLCDHSFVNLPRVQCHTNKAYSQCNVNANVQWQCHNDKFMSMAQCSKKLLFLKIKLKITCSAQQPLILKYQRCWFQSLYLLIYQHQKMVNLGEMCIMNHHGLSFIACCSAWRSSWFDRWLLLLCHRANFLRWYCVLRDIITKA